MLSKIVTKYLKMLDDENEIINKTNINYKAEIDNLNKICENIMKK